MSNWRRLTGVGAGLSLAWLMMSLAACGGGGGSAAPAVVPEVTRTGDVGLQVAWPESADRLVPAASLSIKVDVLRNGTPIDGATVTIDAPATTGRINGVAIGEVTLRATAYPQAGAQGTAQATGDLAITVVEGFQDYGTLTMASTIASFAVTPNPAAVTTESTVTLTATAKNAADQVVLLPDAASWSVETGAGFVSLPSGRAVGSYSTSVTGTAQGQATVKVTFTEGTGSPRSATVTVNVTDNVVITIDPTTASLQTNGTQQFAATVTGTANKTVTWSVQEGATGGSVTTAGLYTAPGSAGTYHVVATSQADGTKSASATVTVERSWPRQFGSTGDDVGYGIAVDASGNVYVCGLAGGDLGGGGQGGNDAFVAKYNANGQRLWLRQFGTAEDDEADGLAVDSSGNVYVAGTTFGPLGGANAGNFDAFLAKYDSSGNQVWLKQFGTTGSDQAKCVSLFGAGTVYVGGFTEGNLLGVNKGGNDAFFAQFDADGNRNWVSQFGTTAYDVAWAIGTDSSGNAVVGGETAGNLGGTNSGSIDAFVGKFDNTGDGLWLKQYGSAAADGADDLVVDSNGDVLVVGYSSIAGTVTKLGSLSGTQSWAQGYSAPLGTDGRLTGVVLQGANDIIAGGWFTFRDFILNKTSHGYMLKNFSSTGTGGPGSSGTSGQNDFHYDLARDSTGRLFMTGSTDGSVGAANAGGTDVTIRAFTSGLNEIR